MRQQIHMACKKLLAWYRRKRCSTIQIEEGTTTNMQIQDRSSSTDAPIKGSLNTSALEKSQANFSVLNSSSLQQGSRIEDPCHQSGLKASNSAMNGSLSFDNGNSPTFRFNKNANKIKSTTILPLQGLKNTRKEGLGHSEFEQSALATNTDIEKINKDSKLSRGRKKMKKGVAIHPTQEIIKNSRHSESPKQQKAPKSDSTENKQITYEGNTNQNQEYKATLPLYNHSGSDTLSLPQTELYTIGRTRQSRNNVDSLMKSRNTKEPGLVKPRGTRKGESPELLINNEPVNKGKEQIRSLNQKNYHEGLNQTQQEEKSYNDTKLRMLPDDRNKGGANERLQASPEIKSDTAMNKQDEFRNHFWFVNKALQRVAEDKGIQIDKEDPQSYLSRFLRGKQ